MTFLKSVARLELATRIPRGGAGTNRPGVGVRGALLTLLGDVFDALFVGVSAELSDDIEPIQSYYTLCAESDRVPPSFHTYAAVSNTSHIMIIYYKWILEFGENVCGDALGLCPACSIVCIYMDHTFIIGCCVAAKLRKQICRI